MKNNTYTLSPLHFLICHKGQCVLWNCKTHEQFIIDEDCLERLKLWSMHPPSTLTDQDHEFIERAIVIPDDAASAAPWGWDLLAQLYHQGTSSLPRPVITSPTAWVKKYKEFSQTRTATECPLFVEREGDIYPLPAPSDSLDNVSLLSALKQRKTSRVFFDRAISLEHLSVLLYTAFGWFHKDDNECADKGFEPLMIRKTAPAAGGLHCNEAYVVIRRVDGVPAGIYHYSVAHHHLTRINDWDEGFGTLLMGQFYANNLSVGIFITSYFDKLWWKYPHSRGYRMALMDAGHLSQTFHLTAAALSLDSWTTGAFDDDEVRSLLGLKQSYHAPLLFIGAGHGTHEGIPHEFTQNE